MRDHSIRETIHPSPTIQGHAEVPSQLPNPTLAREALLPELATVVSFVTKINPKGAIYNDPNIDAIVFGSTI